MCKIFSFKMRTIQGNKGSKVKKKITYNLILDFAIS